MALTAYANGIVTVEGYTVARVYEQIALYDHNVELEPGVYRGRFTTIDGRDVPEGSRPYYLVAKIPARLCADDVNGGRKAGHKVTYHLQRYAYSVES